MSSNTRRSDEGQPKRDVVITVMDKVVILIIEEGIMVAANRKRENRFNFQLDSKRL